MATLPTVVGVSTFQSGTTTTTVGPTVTGVQVNDLILIFVETANQAVNTPTGYTQLASSSPQSTGVAGATTATRLTVFWKIATANNETCPAITGTATDHIGAFGLALRNVDPLTPINTSAGAVLAVASTSITTIPSVSATRSNCRVVTAVANANDAAVARFSAWTVNSGALFVSGYAEITNADAGTATGNGGGIGIASGTILSPATGTFSVTQTSSVAAMITIAVNGLPASFALDSTPGSFAVTGASAQLTKASKLLTTPGAFAITGASAALLKASKLLTTAGSFAISGAPATLLRGYSLNTSAGSFVVSGAAATLLKSSKLVTTAGSFALAGASANLAAARALSTSPGSFALTGASANLAAARALTTTAGSFAVSGADASLLAARTLASVAGSFTATGSDATLLATRALSGSPGSFNVAGSAAELLASRVLATAPGEFVLSGADASLLAARTLTTSPGSYTVTGADADLTVESAAPGDLASTPGEFLLTGFDATLVKSGAPVQPPAVVQGGAGRRTPKTVLQVPPRRLVLNALPGRLAISWAPVTIRTVRGPLTFEAPIPAVGLVGAPARMSVSRVLVAKPGEFGLTGTVAGMNRNRVLDGAIPAVEVVGYGAGWEIVRPVVELPPPAVPVARQFLPLFKPAPRPPPGPVSFTASRAYRRRRPPPKR